MEGVWLRWQAGTRKAVNKPNSVAGRSGVTKEMAYLVYRTITPPLSRDHNRYIYVYDTKSSRSRIDKRTARATGNTRYRYNKIAPLDHKMADNCVSLARTNTLSSTITKPIKTSKTSNKSYSYNLLNRINKMYTHDLFYLHKEWEAWLAPVYIQIRTTKSQLTQCTKYKCH